MLFKKKQTWVRFVNLIPGVELVHPVIPTSEMNVDWIKRAAKDYREQLVNNLDPTKQQVSVSRCPGILNLYKFGYVVTNPVDFVITTNDIDQQGKVHWETSADYSGVDGRPYISTHSREQLGDFLNFRVDTLGSIIKVNTKWQVTMSDDIVLLQLPIPYPEHNYFSAVPGVLDGRYNTMINVQLQWHRRKDKILVKAGTPLCQYIPVPRDFTPNLVVERATADDEYLSQAWSYIDNKQYNKDKSSWYKQAAALIKKWRK